MAPPPSFVLEQISQLLFWSENSEVHPLIKSCLFHYKWKSLFAWLPVESLIKNRQNNYYTVLGECDKPADSEKFIEFMLESIRDSLVEISSTEQVGVQVSEQVEILLSAIGKDTVSGKELMERVGLKHRPTFRKYYLLPAIENSYLEMTILDKPNSSKQKYRKSKT